MKDSEFLELLNLYLDHEISPADAARLEAEVRSNAERRRTYGQYCRMQKACALLAADFAENPAAVREPAVQRLGWAAAGFASFGLVAAGVAVALVLWQRSPGTRPAAGPTLAVVSPSANEPKRGLVAASDKPAAPRLTLVGESLALSSGLQAGGGMQPRTSADQLEWLRNFQVATVPVAGGAATLHFNHSASPQSSEVRQLGLKAQAEAAEMTAFRFAK